MTMNQKRPYEDIIAQLEDPEKWSKTSVEDVLRVAKNVAWNELRFQMRLWATRDPGFSPMVAIGALTAVQVDELAHRDEVRFSVGR